MKTSTLRARSVLVAVFAASVCGQAFGAFEVFTTRMDGAQESPPVISNGIGWGTFVYDDVANTLRMQVDFSGLTGVTTVAHIHGATTLTPFVGNAGVIVQPPTLLNFPVGVSGGSYDQTFDLGATGTYAAGWITSNGGTTNGARDGLLNLMRTGRAYFNIHSSFASGGEIRGYIPAPSAAAALAMGGLLIARRRR